MTEVSIQDLLNIVSGSNQEAPLSKAQYAETISALIRAKELFYEANTFIEGDIVRYKPGMAIARMPKEDQPAIVVGVLAQPIAYDLARGVDVSDTLKATIQFDLKIGYAHDDGTYVEEYVDSRRFERYVKGA